MKETIKKKPILLGLGLLVLLVLVFYENPDVAELNNLLEADKKVSAYPYEFRVIKLENRQAVMTTPRSTAFPAQRALELMYPHLANRAQDNPDVINAQEKLAEVQKRAKAIVIDSEKVDGVRWELDKSWLSRYGIIIN